MWHEARKHEKKIRGIMIDHRRRAEKRREFYESIRRDPASYLQIHGQQMKIHIDPVISQQAESSLVPWMGEKDNMIDRFDVRTNLESIPTAGDVNSIGGDSDNLTTDQECQLNYERFRNLVQHDFLDHTEEKVLEKIYLKERVGPQNANNVKSKTELKKKLAEKKAAIGYNYDEAENKTANNKEESGSSDESDEEEEEFEDLDTVVYVDQLDPDLCQRLNVVAKKYGIKPGSFIKFMQADKAEADRLRIAKEIENEKSMFVGRKSRRERKVLIQQRLLILRSINNDDCEVDHFGSEGTANKQEKSRSDSETSSEEDDDDDDDNIKSGTEEGKIEFITSFGNDEDETKEKHFNIKKKIKKSDKKRLKESKKKPLKSDKFKQMKQDDEPLMYGPSLPAFTSDHKNVDSSVRFNATNSQMKNRRYRVQDEESDNEKFSPPRTVRRSPSVRRRHSSSEDSSDSDENIRRRRLRSRSPRSRSPPSRYRRSRSRDRHRKRSHSRDRHRSSPMYRRSHYRSRKSRTRSPLRRSSKERRRSKSRERKERRHGSSSSQIVHQPSKETTKFYEEEENSKLYKLVLKVENDCKNKSSNSSQEIKNGNQEKLNSETVLYKEKSPPVKRYYRHDLVESGDDASDDDDDNDSHQKFKSGDMSSLNKNTNQTTATSKQPLTNLTASKTCPVVTPQERLKRLMQAQLDKQYKLDKKAENDRLERQKMERKEELSKLSKHQRSRRSRSSSSYDSSDRSDSYSSDERRRRRHKKRYNRSRSRSASRHYHHDKHRRSSSRRSSREHYSYHDKSYRRRRSYSRSS